jgi:hypothetical protein
MRKYIDAMDWLRINVKPFFYPSFVGLDPHGLYGSVTRDPLWTPSRKCDFTTPPPMTAGPAAAPAPVVSSVTLVAPVASLGNEMKGCVAEGHFLKGG